MQEPVPAKKVKNLYDSFVSDRDRQERGLTDSSEGGKRSGNTIYVFGYSITEEIMRSTFEGSGKIVSKGFEFLYILYTSTLNTH